MILISAIKRQQQQLFLYNKCCEPQINGRFVMFIHVEKAVIYDKEMSASAHNHDNSGIGIGILEENWIPIFSIIADITFCEMCT